MSDTNTPAIAQKPPSAVAVPTEGSESSTTPQALLRVHEELSKFTPGVLPLRVADHHFCVKLNDDEDVYCSLKVTVTHRAGDFLCPYRSDWVETVVSGGPDNGAKKIWTHCYYQRNNVLEFFDYNIHPLARYVDRLRNLYAELPNLSLLFGEDNEDNDVVEGEQTEGSESSTTSQAPQPPQPPQPPQAVAVYADIQDARLRIERLEKTLADQQAERAFASTMVEELAFLLPILKKGVECSAMRDSRSERWANCTIIKVHECSEDKYKTEYDILFYDCTQPVKFPLKRMSLHRMPLRKEEQTAYYHDSKKACEALLAQIDDAAEDDAEVTE